MQKILLVDDEALILYSLSRTLRHCGAAVQVVTNSADALSEIMKTIWKLSPATGMIIMTANRLTEEQQRMISSHGGQFIPKPFDIDQVQTIVASLSSRLAAGK